MLRIEHVDVFHGDARALDDVSLEVEEGTIVAIVGANGAGKTSLIRTIAGMHRPARGRIEFRGTDIGGWDSHRVCNFGIGQVAEGRQVFPELSVIDNLRLRAASAGIAIISTSVRATAEVVCRVCGCRQQMLTHCCGSRMAVIRVSPTAASMQ